MIHRVVATSAGQTILNRFGNLRTWEFLINGADKSELFYGHIHSGEELIYIKNVKTNLSQLMQQKKVEKWKEPALVFNKKSVNLKSD